MRSDLTAALSEFSDKKSNCFPCLHKPRKPIQPYLRQYNSSELQVREIPLMVPQNSNFKHPSTSHISSRCRKILHDQRLVNKRKLQDINLLSGIESVTRETIGIATLPVETRIRSNSLLIEKKRVQINQLFALQICEARNTIKTEKTTEDHHQFRLLTVTKLNGKDSTKQHRLRFFTDIQRKPYMRIPISMSSKPSSTTSNNQSRNSPIASRTPKQSLPQSPQRKLITSCIQKEKEKVKQKNFQPVYVEEHTEQSIQFHEPSSLDQLYVNKELFQNVEDFKGQIHNQAFSITHLKNMQYMTLAEFNPNSRMEIASLTKIMTCLLILKIAERFKIDLKQAYTKVGHKAASLQGTTAKLSYADYVCVGDLLYGMMLPSGNDAAQTLAEWGGKTIRFFCNKQTIKSSPRKTKLIRKGDLFKRTSIGLFIYHMNILAKALSMKNSRFANAHGLINKKNYSCSSDVTKLCVYAMQRLDFRGIVSRKQYMCTVQNKKYASKRVLSWSNTNKLLKLDMFCGIKTGITPSAGPCLASCFQVSPGESIFIVLLNTLTVTHRFEESKRLLTSTLKTLYEKTSDKNYLVRLQGLKEENLDVLPEQIIEDTNNFQPSEDTEIFQEDRMGELQL